MTTDTMTKPRMVSFKDRLAGDHFIREILSTEPRHDPDVKWVTVTPEIAADWLERNVKNNRPVRPRHVAGMVRDIKAGYWQQNGATIVFDCEGRLHDGQHRLAAVIEAGEPIRVLVVFNVDFASLSTIDQGKKRSGADVLHIGGETEATMLSSIAQLVWRQDRGFNLFQGNYAPTAQEIGETVSRHPELRDAVAPARSCKAFLPASIGGWMFWNCAQIDADLAASFFQSLRTGEGLRSSDPIYRLRETLIGFRGANRKQPNRDYVAAICIKAWNAVRLGKRVEVLRYVANEHFPEFA